MGKIALIYSFNTNKTKRIAQTIISNLKDCEVIDINADTLTSDQFLLYNNLILGVPTWFDGELPGYWDEFIPELLTLDLSGKKVAIFGLGDAIGYPSNFGDAVGIMAQIVESKGATIVGQTVAAAGEGLKSKALRDDKFLGLVLDYDNDKDKAELLAKEWAALVRKEFEV